MKSNAFTTLYILNIDECPLQGLKFHYVFSYKSKVKETENHKYTSQTTVNLHTRFYQPIPLQSKNSKSSFVC